MSHSDRPRLVIIDGHAQLYRAYFAFPPSLTAPNGEVVNAVYGFTRMLLNLIDELTPNYLAASFDIGETFRHKEFPAYKAQREKMPDDLKSQEPIVQEVLQAFNVPVFTEVGYEADDVIGSMAKQVACIGDHPSTGTDECLDVVIVTGDMDALQLVQDGSKEEGSIKVYSPGNKWAGPRLFDEAAVVDKHSFRPEQVIDFKALAGDSSDNIPGVKGVGKKTATSLVQEFGTLEGIYEALESLDSLDDDKRKLFKPALIKKLTNEKENAFHSKYLVTIVTDLKVDFDLEQARLGNYKREDAEEAILDLGFKSLVNNLPRDEFETQVYEMLS